MRYQRHVLIPAVVLSLLAISCSSSRGGMASIRSSGDPSITSPTTVAEATTTTPASSVPLEVIATTAVAPTLPPNTTAVITPATEAPIALPSDDDDPLLLRSEGFGRFSFGSPVNDVLIGSPSELGVPSSDQVSRFPVATGSQFQSADEETAFGLQVAREVCWTQFCLTFGGADEASLKLVGWHYDGNGSVPLFGLRNAADITLGSRWSDFASAMDADPGGCYTIGGGATDDGIFLVLEGGLFGQFNADGSYEALLPDPTEVTVQSMNAGEQIEFLLGDC
jgi:hypothetical protein